LQERIKQGFNDSPKGACLELTMQLIETKTLGTAAASIEFTSIPQDGTDLLITTSVRSTFASNQDSLYYRFNGSSSGYSYRQLFGGAGGGSIITGSAAQTSISFAFSGIVPATNNTTNTFSSQQLYIPNYAGSANKTVSSESGAENNAATNFQLDVIATIWANTAAITSVLLYPANGSTWATGSSISLYKITKGSSNGVVVS
jgi:hypothetical protein